MKTGNKRQRLALAAIIAGVFSLAMFQNCSNGFHAQNLETSNQPSSTEDVPSTETPQLVRTDFLTGLDSPWDMAFLPDGTMFFTERCRGLSVRMPTGQIRRLFGAAGNAVVAADFFCEGQSGMHGIAIDPNFAANRSIFVYMPSNLSNPKSNRVLRLVVDAGFTTVSNRTDIITDIAYKNASNNWGGAGSHSGGRLRFGPDGFLYVTTGDNHNGTIPQSPTVLGGKVLRVDRDGTGAPGNNVPPGWDPRIYTYGHRNVQGIAFQPKTGQPFISEHGPGHDDEVTPLVAGGNGGWDPAPAVGVTCADNYCGYISNRPDGTPTSMTDLQKFPNAMRPLWNNGGESEGMSPCEFLSGNQWKAWNGRLVVGFLAGKRIEVLQLNQNGGLAGTTRANLPAQRIRATVQGPDGNLYVAVDSGTIWKVVPQ